jgi:hypothetical protein
MTTGRAKLLAAIANGARGTQSPTRTQRMFWSA